jgi:hypothetical protein
VDPSAVDTEFMSRAGMRGAPKTLTIPPERVARKILRAVTTRPAVLNASPWQSPLLGLGELLPGTTDFVLARIPQLVGNEVTLDAPASLAAPPALPAGDVPDDALGATLEIALAPLAHRMERLKLSRAFVAGLLAPGTTLDAGDVALRWAGMPNKNERGLTQDVLDALAAAGLIEATGDGTYRVR